MTEVLDGMQRAFNALNAMDPQHALRAELAEAGVSRSQILSLYPLDFFDLAPALLEHVRSLDLNYLRKWQAELKGAYNLGDQAAFHQGQEFFAEYSAEHILQRGASAPMAELEHHIMDALGGADSGQAIDISLKLPSVIWAGWWLRHRDDSMNKLAQFSYASDTLLYGVATAYLPSLLDRA